MSDLIPLLERSIAIAKAKAGPVIGASQIAAILGIDPFKTAAQLFDEMTGRAPPDPENEHMKRGKFMEPGLCAWWVDLAGATRCEARYARNGTVLGNGQLQVFHPEHRWMRATPDIIADVGGVTVAVDVKCPSSTRRQVDGVWVDAWSETKALAPLHYIAQSTYQQGVLLAAGVLVARGELAAGPSWGKLIRVPVPYDAEVFADMLTTAERFRACVLAGELTAEFKTKESNQ